MSSTPSRPSIASSTKQDSARKEKSKTSSGGLNSTSTANSARDSPINKSHTQSKSDKPAKTDKEMSADELADHILADDNSSISSLDVSDDGLENADNASKKRKRVENEPVLEEEEPLAQTILYVPSPTLQFDSHSDSPSLFTLP